MQLRRKWSSVLRAMIVVVLAVVAWWPSRAQADEDGFGFSVVGHQLPGRLCGNEKLMVPVDLRNDGLMPWSETLGDQFAYHWLAADGSVVVREGRRTPIRGVVLPGRTHSLVARVDAPAAPGHYTLAWAMVRDKVRWYPDPQGSAALQRVDVEVGAGATPLGFSITLDSLDPLDPVASIAAGQLSQVRVRLRNEGCAAWSSLYGDSLAYHWFDAEGREVVHEGLRTPLPAVAPGDTAQFDARVEGPPGPGDHVLVFEPVREPLAWFGEPVTGSASSPVEVAPAPLAWSLRSGGDVGQGYAGETVEVRMVVRNEGTESWSSERGDRMAYRLSTADVRAPVIEGVRTVWPREVGPGEEIEIDVALLLPTTPGRYSVRWRPVREQVRWYGPSVDDPDETRDSYVIDVAAPRLAWSVVAATVEHRQWAGRTGVVRVIVRNEGADTWSAAAGDRLSYRWHDAQGGPLDAELGAGMRTELPRDVAPGEQVEIDVRVRAPDKIGAALLEIGMVREHVAWFPQPPTGAIHRVVVMRWGLLLTAAAITALALVGTVARTAPSGRFAAFAREAWAPAHASVACLGFGEIFADLARIEAWTGTAVVSASAAAWIGLPLVLLPRGRRDAGAAAVIVFAFALALVDLGYLDFFGSIVPTSALTALHHLGDAHATVFSLWRPEYLALLWPLLTLVSLFLGRPPRRCGASTRRQRWLARAPVMATLVACAFPATSALIEVANSPIGARVFSERDNVGRLGLWNAHLFEVGRQLARWLGVDALSGAQRREVAEFFETREHARGDSAAPALAPRANLVVIQVEAMQSWVVEAQIAEQPVMPFLSAAESEALYFPFVFDQTAQGRTADAEYLMLQSGHPLRTGALAFLRADNEFETLAHRLGAAGYDTLSAHPYARGFWNRAVLHPRYGFANSLFREEIGEGPMVGWGLSDVEFLQRMAAVLPTRREPFFAFFITLSLHHPYSEFPPSLAELELGDLGGTAVGNYLQGMRHADRGLAAFMEGLEASGLAERTVVLVYGDHVAGLPRSAELDALSGVAQWDPTIPMRGHRVPAFLWLPGAPIAGRDEIPAGHIDLGPTVLDALGLDVPAAFVGRSLLRRVGERVVVLPDGSAVTEDRMWIARGRDSISGGGCFDRRGRARARADCDGLARQAADELWASRAVLDHDLYRSVLQQ